MPKKVAVKKKESDGFGKDRRRKHHHFLVTVFYADGEKFGRVYTDKEKGYALRGAATSLAGGEVRAHLAGFVELLSKNFLRRDSRIRKERFGLVARASGML